MADLFTLKQVLAMVESQLESNPNSCEFEFYKELRDEIIDIITELDPDFMRKDKDEDSD